MEHTDGKFTQAGLGEFYYQGWLPEGDVRAVVFVVHGLAEHGGRYLNVVNQLVPAGFAVYALDHYGHGKSDGTRVFVPRFEDYLTPLKTLLDKVKDWHAGKKVFLLGHSMGGLIGGNFLLDHQDEFAGAVLSGSAAKIPENITSGTLFMARTLSNLLPKVGVTALDANAISRDKAVVDAYVNDPLVYTGKTTARLAAELLVGMQRLAEGKAKIHLPILFIHGEKDALVDVGGSQELFDAVGSADKTIKIYEGYFHETFNDLGKEIPLADLQAWLEAHL